MVRQSFQCVDLMPTFLILLSQPTLGCGVLRNIKIYLLEAGHTLTLAPSTAGLDYKVSFVSVYLPSPHILIVSFVRHTFVFLLVFVACPFTLKAI